MPRGAETFQQVPNGMGDHSTFFLEVSLTFRVGGGVLEMAHACLPWQIELCVQRHQVGSLKVAVVGIFTPLQLAKATNQDFLFPLIRQLLVKHLSAHYNRVLGRHAGNGESSQLLIMRERERERERVFVWKLGLYSGNSRGLRAK
jgi:hypothetical protein